MPAVSPAWCRAIPRQPALVELKLSLLAAVFVALEGPRRCGFSSQGAYAREALGMSAPSFSRRRRVGVFLLHSRAARAGLLSGAFGFGALELLLRRVPCGSADELLGLLPGRSLAEIEATLETMAAPASEPEADPPPDPAPAHEETSQRLRLRMPEPLARLLQQNQQLAAQLCGELDEANATAMWIAEAAAESPAGDPVDNPWRVLGLRRPGVRYRARREGGIRVDLPAPRRLRTHRRKLEQIDRQLVALAQQHRRARSTMRDQLYKLYQDKAWLSLGYSSAEDFADAELGLSARAWWQAIDDARRRARDDPVARARLGMLQLALAGDEPARAAIHWRDGWRCANPAWTCTCARARARPCPAG